MIIAIDGPAASGKGTIGALVARYFGYHCLDTGLLYRGVAHALMEAETSPDDPEAPVALARTLPMETLDEAILGVPAVAEIASRVAARPDVRAALVERQRTFAAQPPGAVLVGRDIGTVICPDADVKIYLTADVAVRAGRRADQLQIRGEDDRRRILEGIVARDDRDMNRPVAPLRQADDARLLDTTDLDIEASFRAAVAIVEERRGT